MRSTLALALLGLLAISCGSKGGGDVMDLSDRKPHCEDGIRDVDETDSDCGGPTCSPCAGGLICAANTDCQSGSCVMKVCAGGNDGGGIDLSGPHPDLSLADLSGVDLSVPVVHDLSTPGCTSNGQCMLPNAVGICGEMGDCVIGGCQQGYADCDKVAANGCEVATQTDSANCGACGTSCATVLNGVGACTAGACTIASCTAGFANCDGKFSSGCVTATSSDLANCGACGKVCDPPNSVPACTKGACSVSSCSPGFADCDKNPVNGCEVATTSDLSNCGGCMVACMSPANGSPACVKGACAIGMCKFGFADCDKNPANGCELAVSSDVNNCGACANKCPAVANASIGCNSGVCGIGACNMLYGDCDNNPANGCEKNLASDVLNCGACGNTCIFNNATGTCTNGACAITSCNQGFVDCNKMANDGCEVDVQADATNCGACGNVCPVNTPLCMAGKCAARFMFAASQSINGQTVVCSAVVNNGMYTECDNIMEGGYFLSNGVNCGQMFSIQPSQSTDFAGLCTSLISSPMFEAYYDCGASAIRATWKANTWGTTTDTTFTRDLRCYY